MYRHRSRTIANVIGIFLLCILFVGCVGSCIHGTYTYEKKYLSYWDLADKSSTLERKSEYMDKYVGALETAGLSGMHNAVFLYTPNNSFDANLAALKTLQNRLKEIQKMDVSSFQYQVAIQQITVQEQGEAIMMNSVLLGVWWKKHHPIWWFFVIKFTSPLMLQ